MNSDQAKEILLLYRPNSADALEPEVAEALELAGRDPDLGRWLAEHCAVQSALQSSFRQIPVPEGLKEQILSERKAHTTFSQRRKMVLAAVCALAVIFLAGLALTVSRPQDDRTFANFESRMIGKIARASNYPQMDLETNDSSRILQFLAQSNAPARSEPPALLTKATSTGCAVLKWQGKIVSMICYNSGINGATNAPDLFLFVARRQDVPRAPALATPEFEQRDKLSIASWSSGDCTYVLAGLGDESFLRKYF